MKSLGDHIAYVKEQPHEVRRKVSFGVAGAVTGLVGIVWLGGGLLTGAFSIQGASFAEANHDAAVQAVAPSDSGVAGAAAAFSGAQTPRIEIVDTSSTSAPEQKPEPTVIPF